METPRWCLVTSIGAIAARRVEKSDNKKRLFEHIIHNNQMER